MACKKTLTLQIADVPDPVNYWRCNDLVAGRTSEENVGAACDLVRGFVSTDPTLDTGIIGNCLRSSVVWPQYTVYAASIGPVDAYTAFTLRAWVKVVPAGINHGIGLPWIGHYPLSTLAYFAFRNTGTCDIAAVASDSGGAATVLCGADPGDTNWHRLVAMVDKGTSMFYFKVDNDATASVLLPDPFVAEDTDFRVYWKHPTNHGDVGTVYLCEIAEWDRMLSDAELLIDWNGGAGRTFYGGAWHTTP